MIIIPMASSFCFPSVFDVGKPAPKKKRRSPARSKTARTLAVAG
jgi:hypothetical protein